MNPTSSFPHSIPFQHFGLSDIGHSRPSNQDYWAAWPEIGLFALADGMGGRNGGEIAAREAVSSLGESLRQLLLLDNQTDCSADLYLAIEHANTWVYKMGCDVKPLSGMGTTLTCLLWTPGLVYYAHVGDSRIYRLRQNKLQLLTRDHSLLVRWLSKKKLYGPSPPKNIITRAIGTKGKALPDIASCESLEDDQFLLCSDGLSDVLTLSEIEKILLSSSTQETVAKQLIDIAKNKGSKDNITVLLIGRKF